MTFHSNSFLSCEASRIWRRQFLPSPDPDFTQRRRCLLPPPTHRQAPPGLFLEWWLASRGRGTRTGDGLHKVEGLRWRRPLACSPTAAARSTPLTEARFPNGDDAISSSPPAMDHVWSGVRSRAKSAPSPASPSMVPSHPDTKGDGGLLPAPASLIPE